jgi:hypothetical protein
MTSSESPSERAFKSSLAVGHLKGSTAIQKPSSARTSPELGALTGAGAGGAAVAAHERVASRALMACSSVLTSCADWMLRGIFFEAEWQRGGERKKLEWTRAKSLALRGKWQILVLRQRRANRPLQVLVAGVGEG